MSDDLVSRLRQDAEMLQDGPQSNLTKLWHSEVVKDAAKDCQEAATALTEARAEIERLGAQREADNKRLKIQRDNALLDMEDHMNRAEQAERARSELASQNTNMRNDLVLAGMARDTAERVFTDICEELGCKPDNEVALEAVAALKHALAEAVEVMRSLVARYEPRIPELDPDKYSNTIAELKTARAFIASQEPAEQEK